MSKVVSAILLTMLTSIVLMLTFPQLAKAEFTWTVDDDGPADFSKIQDAINAASPLDTIYVKSGTYYENIEVKKPLSLVGEDKYTTIVDGGNLSSVIYISVGYVSNVKVQNFTFRNSKQFYPGSGVYIYNTRGVIICNNIIIDNLIGIYLSHAYFNTLVNNYVSKNYYGIWGDHGSINNTIRNNAVFSNSQYGIYLGLSDNNNVKANTIYNNNYGLGIFQTNNTIVHNNFINNTYQSGAYQSANRWDIHGEGNYWSNYNGIDSNRDGIGDTAYVISAYGQDNYPLMGLFHSFNSSLGYFVNIISNSTLEDFQYFASNNTIKLHVSNMTAHQIFGFCRITIPIALLSEPYNVRIDGANPVYWNFSLSDNGTHKWIYFAYEHSTVEIVIVSEFPSVFVLLLLVIAVLPLVMAYRRKRYQNRGVVME